MKPDKRNYTKAEIAAALNLYDETESITLVIQKLGYPSRTALYKWIKERDKPKQDRRRGNGTNTPQHPRHPSLEVKLNILHRCFELGEDVLLVAEEVGYTRSSIYAWRKKYLQQGAVGLMNSKKDLPRGELDSAKQDISFTKDDLEARLREMQLEIDILKETINVLKKDPGVNLESLKNREKAVIIDALKDKYSLPTLLDKLDMPRSSYYYQEASMARKDKFAEKRAKIAEIFHDSKECYGYRRIHEALKKENIILSEKVIRRIMKEDHLSVKTKGVRKYSSYQGEISPEVPNIIQRDFHSEGINEKWVTDITEFAIPAGKVYLSPIIDCFDGLPVSWTIGISPNAELVNTMLDKAIMFLNDGEHPIVHTDRGCHYRWPGWIERMEKVGLIRSMSKKGCSPDNSACEGFFGRLKNEMFYGRDWRGVTIEEFIEQLDAYLHWYSEKRIKLSLGGLSPIQYRKSLGLIAA